MQVQLNYFQGNIIDLETKVTLADKWQEPILKMFDDKSYNVTVDLPSLETATKIHYLIKVNENEAILLITPPLNGKLGFDDIYEIVYACRKNFYKRTNLQVINND